MTDEIHITFMRHARSRADDENVHEGRYDSPLTDVGRSQVQARAEFFKREGFQFDVIIASTLSRAKESAEIIGRELNAPVEFDTDWMEFDTGPLAGVPLDEAKVRFPQPVFRNPYEKFWETGETEWGFHSRAVRAVEKVVQRGAGRYLVVAHGGILNAAMRMIVGATVPINYHGAWFHFADTGYVKTFYRPHEHTWHILEMKNS